ncbi:uncharacterized protein LOC133284058 [Gastrolobium bilobum]|uniref:uncharacterized protein LOC133284058 n=1 Tax=Gastrolobium bilobum TaxID=150636 RepID=UPI002AB11860|nr:uncharacterized protein LOC133284058 [Gastrolobium bilobum]
MADPRFNVPFHESSFDAPPSPNFFDFDLSNTSLPQLQTHDQHDEVQQGGGNNDHNYSESDPMIQDHIVHDSSFPYGGGRNFEAGGSSSQMHGDGFQSQHHANENLGGGSQSQNNQVLALDYWPVPPAPFFCSCCQVLREIVHTNGIKFEKLEIHGRLGVISHAIHHKNISRGSTSNPQYEMIEYVLVLATTFVFCGNFVEESFCQRNIEEVKQFLIQYCQGQSSAGYFIMQDPMSIYYDALCTGLDWTEDINDDFVDLNPSAPNADDTEQEADNERAPKLPISAQRERAAKMQLSDVSDYFHLPIDEAARQLNLSTTVVKKICRKAGLARWPHRKIKSVWKQITILTRTLLESEDEESRENTQAEINRLEHDMIQHCGGIAPTALNLENLDI